ncbi:MAG: hypothetical protein OYH76_01230 [Defluviicoccus sp.]|nr:hypothetical protein [Defluviicoccus sp.]MDE0274486.1 hypothetical protein [Defluviicoccus sp.]
MTAAQHPQTTPQDIARAYESFFDALVRGPWDYRPDRALAELEARRRELRTLAVQIDRSLWPPGVATLLWAPASHERISGETRGTVVEMPDCLGCE